MEVFLTESPRAELEAANRFLERINTIRASRAENHSRG